MVFEKKQNKKQNQYCVTNLEIPYILDTDTVAITKGWDAITVASCNAISPNVGEISDNEERAGGCTVKQTGKEDIYKGDE